ncbi:ATP synthase F0, B subunit [Mobiluncus mulieris 28-1]|uniref:ATP synthase subunit b n=1 Tax=Mobiluncus mulieris ATCC 35239 TaxID=871571 RepID=E0QPE4_9ACTO|nr:F0F1 ATP synthase subunit B [Mobiluncus mulieris]EEZ90714.1 ATP synthase F0, B subunit [Mobiluncus mulieris 28-1]EFM46577.1 ATP synthase F0, B subunit [Mobiluncus mulieris ATCC 35239]EFN92698.1 ATP synthase F0, B subunit [Mobiluncus mulieris FB024-16]MCU9996859.1 F0F1 ATP synthase subunit B [Mobiluncus mulieris]PNL42420.1 F0F1 ATP synthase subunit B [Mobiluncus mulieris]
MEYVNSLVAAVAAAEDRNPLLPAMYDIVWSAIIFAIILFVIVKVALPKYNTLADERAMKLQEGLDATTKAHEESQKAESRIAAELTEAKAEAAKIRDQAVAQAEDIVARAQARAEQEAKRIVETAQRQIEAERVAAEQSLRAEVGGLATQLAEKIVGEQLKDEALSARVVDRFLDELDKQVAAV